MPPPPQSNAGSVHLRVRDTLISASAALPRHADILALRAEMAPALERGWFRPSEDERIRQIFADYLHVRAALHECLLQLRPQVRLWLPGKPDLPAFVLSWTAGCMLMRAARYMVREFIDVKAVRTLLNQAEPRFAIPEGLFDEIYAASTHPATILRFLRAAHYAETHADAINRLREDPDFAVLPDLLAAEAPFIALQKRQHSALLLRNRWDRLRARPHATYRGVMRGIFERSGRIIAECRNPFHRKRVNRRVRHLVSRELQPGDLLVTRHDDALSNLFLPGFWPHAALIIGHAEQRDALGVQTDPARAARCRPPLCILEAKKDGVRFRSLRETLHVDAFALLRPRFPGPDIQRRVIERALSHEGKPYDFEFDFTRADRLVCTEVLYRSLDEVAGFHLNPKPVSGRLALPAQDLLRQLLHENHVEVRLLYGVRGNQIQRGERAREMLTRTLQ